MDKIIFMTKTPSVNSQVIRISAEAFNAIAEIAENINAPIGPIASELIKFAAERVDYSVEKVVVKVTAKEGEFEQ